MKRTTISLDEPMLRELHHVAAMRGISIAAVVREAVGEKLASFRPRPRSLAVGASGHTNTARQDGDERPEPRSRR
jgi:Ribbon-helix-helix protein, copG family